MPAALAAAEATTGTGDALHALCARLYPICRSITGDGVRETLAILGERIPLDGHEVPSGTPVFDWTVPREWNIRDAYVANSRGERVIDFRAHNLHVVSYSMPVRARMRLAELRPHLHSDPAHPDWIPYRTSYYAEAWGFCLSHNALQALPDDDYEVVIDSTLADGALTYGECLVPGETADEVLVSAHICHPSLANDNLSGLVVATELARRLLATTAPAQLPLPLHPRHHRLDHLAGAERGAARRASSTASSRSISATPASRTTRRAAAAPPRSTASPRTCSPPAARTRSSPFSPYGYDERQFCSPGIDLPVGCLSHTPYGQFPEYHTSADNLDLVRPEALAASLDTFEAIFEILERNRRYLNLSPKCEPQLGRRGLYAALGGRSDTRDRQMAMLWVLNQSDGGPDLLAIAERANLPFALVADAADALAAHDLLAPA